MNIFRESETAKLEGTAVIIPPDTVPWLAAALIPAVSPIAVGTRA